jgi:hypothetical protein
MKASIHQIVHQYQPTPTTCSQTALSILLGYYEKHITPQEIEKLVPQVKDKHGKDSGTITQLLAAWCKNEGYDVSLYTFDCQIIDQTWSGLTPSNISDRLSKSLEGGWTVPGLGEEWSKAYRQAYIDYLKTNSELIIQPAVTSKLLYDLLKQAPMFSTVCINTLYGSGRTKDNNLDDIQGRTWNHSIVIYGSDENGAFLIADPIIEPGLHVVEPERMIAAITAAQIECDNLLFQLH